MIVRCIKSLFPSDDPECLYWSLDISIGKTYKVMAIDGENYRLVGDERRPYLYPIDAFEIKDPKIDPCWVEVHDEIEDGYYFGPPELNVIGLFEDFFDGRQYAQAVVEQYMHR